MRLLGDRSLRFVAENVAQPAHYRALARMARLYEKPLEGYGRYLFGRGSYPARFAVRTPSGTVRPMLWSFHDMLTLNEIFCREDYGVRRPPALVVDVGSNIGLSALYFLTRGPDVRCRLYEPVAGNVERLRRNLEGFEDRYVVEQVAVADFDGEAEFRLDPFGRYGALNQPGDDMTTVPCRHIDAVLEDALAVGDTISLLKIDVEGYERTLLRAAQPELLARVEVIYLEGSAADLPAPAGFAASHSCDTVRLRNAALTA
ncbi:MAG: FkbM family methyltransferase [Actinobacteria bacterium]|nr:FkbM family methyltransferase [Actinomycetota bacterium]